MNNQQFKEALLARKEAISEAMDEYVQEVLLHEASKADSLGNISVNVYEDSLPDDITLQQAEVYLTSNGFDVLLISDGIKDDYIIVGWE